MNTQPAPLQDLPPGTQLYALFDPSGHNELFKRCTQLTAKCRTCLWQGELGRALAEVAPHLVQFTANAFGRFFLGPGQGMEHGYLMISEAGLEELAAHFRRLLMVRAYPFGSALQFRFYDPVVWREYLDRCANRELRALFGPVKTFILRNQDGSLQHWSLNHEGRLHISP